MTDDCVVHLSSGAEKQLAGLARRDPLRAAIIRKLLGQIEENGWILSVKAEIVKVLHESQCIGELRDVGRGGYRLFMF